MTGEGRAVATALDGQHRLGPLLLDLFCKAGGAGMGYHQAGFDVIGVDIEPQRRYPFAFEQGDAFEVLHRLLAGGTVMGHGLSDFAAIHASPPCQAHSDLRHIAQAGHVDLIAPTRPLLIATGLPYVIENVVGAPLHDPVVLCGTMFGLGAGGRDLWRHRLFECSFVVDRIPPCRHNGSPVGVYGTGAGGQHPRGYRASADEAREAMQMPWATKAECSQAVPPAYTEFIGRQLRAELLSDQWEVRDAA